jgi:poly(A) polymerase
MAKLTAAGIQVTPTGLDHGTVTAISNGVRFEITTLRQDLRCDGRHAQVAFTEDWLADAARRDLTINALSCTADGLVYDPFGGIEDLAAGRVRFIGRAHERIGEDTLRLLRFFRFYGRYGRPPPDNEALEACRMLAPRLSDLSGERVRTELFRILAHDRCSEVWALMLATSVMPHLIPSAIRVDRLAALVALEKALGLGPADDRAIVRLAALLTANRTETEGIAQRLRLSRAERDRLVGLVAPPVTPQPDDPPLCLRRALVSLRDAGRFQDLILLAAATTPGAFESTPSALSSVLTMAADWRAARFPLSGSDLLAQGLPAGPAIGHWLHALEDWWAEDHFRPDREACLGELKRRTANSRWNEKT